jgi:IS605 OrfB family transposase
VIISFLQLVSVGYSDQRISDWEFASGLAGLPARCAGGSGKVVSGPVADPAGSGTSTSRTAWKETVRDAVADIRAHREAAKAEVRRRVGRRLVPEAERKRLYTLLTRDRWAGDPLLRRWMRGQWRRGHNHTGNQVIIRSDNVRTFTLTEGGEVWLSVPGLGPGAGVVVPPATTVAPAGTLRVILRGDRVEVHYQIDDTAVTSAHRGCGTATVGVDKGYSEVLVDTDGDHHGPELGELLRRRCDTLKERNARRAKPRSIANQAGGRGRHGTAERIRRTNLGTIKGHRQRRRWERQVATVTYRAVNAVVDKASVIVAEDLSRTFTGRNKRGANTNRRLAAWTKGITAEALKNVSGRRGSAVRLVNAAYTSQVIPGTRLFGRRVGVRLYCPHPGRVVWHAEDAAAINVLDRAADADIGLYTPHSRVKQIIGDRADGQRSRLPDQDSTATGHCRCGERNIQSRSTLIEE